MSKDKARLLVYVMGLVLAVGFLAIWFEGQAWQTLSMVASAAVIQVTWPLLVLRKIPLYFYGSMVALAVPGAPLMFMVSLGNLGAITGFWWYIGTMVGWSAWMVLFMTLEKRWLRPNW